MPDVRWRWIVDMSSGNINVTCNGQTMPFSRISVVDDEILEGRLMDGMPVVYGNPIPVRRLVLEIEVTPGNPTHTVDVITMDGPAGVLQRLQLGLSRDG